MKFSPKTQLKNGLPLLTVNWLNVWKYHSDLFCYFDTVNLFLRGGNLLCLLLLLASAAPLRAAEAATSLFPPQVKRVVFLGDSITYAGQYVEDIAACQQALFPNCPVDVINVGLPSETVSGLSEPGHAGGQFPRPDLHERLARVLAKTRPDLVFACYGMNDGIYLPLDAGRFQAYREGITWLHTHMTRAGIRLVLVTPPVFDETKGGHPGYEKVMAVYSAWLASQRTNGWEVVDLQTPMRQYLTAQRARDPAFALAHDGVHPDDLGHWLMAQAILEYLGVTEAKSADSIGTFLARYPGGGRVLAGVQASQRMWKDAWLTETGHKRPGMKRGLPLVFDPKTGTARLNTNQPAPAAGP